MVKETSKLPSVRALIELKAKYLSAIYSQEKDDTKKVESAVSAVHNKVAASAIKKYMEAMANVDAPYKVVLKDTCKIKSTYSPKLNFELEFDPSQHIDTVKYADTIKRVTATRRKEVERLEAWFENCLYLVASKNPEIPKFK